jgi:hypothetical protein
MEYYLRALTTMETEPIEEEERRQTREEAATAGTASTLVFLPTRQHLITIGSSP